MFHYHKGQYDDKQTRENPLSLHPINRFKLEAQVSLYRSPDINKSS
jgi:hypothetical protein